MNSGLNSKTAFHTRESSYCFLRVLAIAS